MEKRIIEILDELELKLDTRMYDEDVLEYYNIDELVLFRTLTIDCHMHPSIAVDCLASRNIDSIKELNKFFSRYLPLMKFN
ncbi:hypothetical protein D307_gp255 [Bacillus phage Bastille]|nr:hypothetical protein D307_gp255 [Bacillus phage Bastille]YP_009035600.1 hypothetical protein FP76_gp291 [Bacillus phage Evoli]YP_009036978.1 hypothetical protein FP74_gp284 [Bacillus phage CAM003]AMW61832.1 hypothetical protein DNAM5_88 [Bacillus phage Vinny]ASU00927.1 hypothetical protein ANTHONY_87 [Bacillus phage Anthony]AZF89181.1 hypothetical protein Goe5_c00750 [Bacillus phage vB_BthM-Goe5]AEQ34209.1 hypothetical protein [Bacillus phage Bastille]AHZ09512.1 hypothetical protein [Baci